MRPEILERFDKVMANLKPIEPSLAFDLEFERRFGETLAERYKETPVAHFARITAERIRYALTPKIPVLIRVMATLLIILSFGFSISQRDTKNAKRFFVSL